MTFSPYSKEFQLRGHQKEKDTPNFKERKYNRRRRKPKEKGVTYHHNRKVPHWKQRGAIHKNERAEALRRYGEHCYICGRPHPEMHHIKEKGYGTGGRGKWRNLIPLCYEHHRGTYGVHGSKGNGLGERLEQLAIDQFGEWYWADEYDLWMAGHIENPTQELFEKFMEGEQNDSMGSRNQANNQ